MTMLKKLWADEAGVVISAELVLIGTLLVIGLIVGLTTLRDHVVQELADIAGAIGELDQSYSFSAITGHQSATAGTQFIDRVDKCDLVGDNDPMDGVGAQCVDVCQGAAGDG